jgi:hypothetical protein
MAAITSAGILVLLSLLPSQALAKRELVPLIWVDPTDVDQPAYRFHYSVSNSSAPTVDLSRPGELSWSNVHFVPIHLYPSTAYAESIFTIVVDAPHGGPAFRAQFGGSGFSGGAAGHMHVSRDHEMRGEVINTPNLMSLQLYDDVTVAQHRTSLWTRVVGLARVGAQLWQVPGESMLFASAQAGLRVERNWGVEQNRFRFDLFAGPAAYRQMAAAQSKPGVETSASVELLY